LCGEHYVDTFFIHSAARDTFGGRAEKMPNFGRELWNGETGQKRERKKEVRASCIGLKGGILEKRFYMTGVG